jgi:hypothetical protein
MLEHHIWEQGYDPRSCTRHNGFRNFFRRANEQQPLHLHFLMNHNIQYHAYRAKKCNIPTTRIVTLEPFSFHGRRTETYKIPVLRFIWKENEAVNSACLALRCCTYSYSAKLRHLSLPLLTDINKAQIRQGRVAWCAKERTWQWTTIALTHIHPSLSPPEAYHFNQTAPLRTDLPRAAFNALLLPADLAASQHAIKPLRCSGCSIWFSNYETLTEHRCFQKSNLDKSDCGSDYRIPITYDLEIYKEPYTLLVCEACMMFFTNTACLQSHQQICTRNPIAGQMYGWRSSYSRVRPWRTSVPSGTYRSLNLLGTPFRKLRAGCDDCIKHFFPQGGWIGAAEQAQQWNLLLRWTRLTLSLALRKIYQNAQIVATMKVWNQSKLSTQGADLRGHLLSF